MYKIITPSATEPVTTESAKTHVKEDLDDATNNAYIDSLVTTARRYLEERTGYNCMENGWVKYLDAWPSDGVIFLHKTPVSEITKIEYYASDEAADYTELSAAMYEKDIISLPARIRINEEPNLGDKLNAVKVTFKAGSTSANNVDQIAKHAILLLVGSMYEHRQDEITGTIVSKLGRNFEWLCEMIEIKSM